MALTFDLVILAQNPSSFEMHINYAMLTIMIFGCAQTNLELELLYTMFCLLLVLGLGSKFNTFKESAWSAKILVGKN